MKKILIKIIEFYQRTLSPDHGFFSYKYPGGYCKYHPDCSEYCKQAIEKKGVTRGIGLGIWRILRCNPWSAGGSDPVD
ncbi:MAG: membrane protein insertion efficiency factor YidD [Patescibacteria group bacterium]